MKSNLYATDMEKLQQIIGCDYDFLRSYDLVIDNNAENIIVTETTVKVLMNLWELKLRREAIFQLMEKVKELNEKYNN